MYCIERTSERLDHAEAQLGWRPVYHSIDEVERVNTRLRSIAVFDDNGKFTGEMTRPYTDQEKWWIRNERTLCSCDAAYALTRYFYIKNEKNEITRFAFRAPQKVYFSVIAELERRGSAVQLQIAKARQLGMSTVTELLVLHRVLFHYGTNALIASSAQQQTQIMTGMIFLAYDRMPHWLVPVPTKRQESERGGLAFGSISSGISFQHGNQSTGIGRGHTPTVAHLSEVASFSNPEELLEESLFNAIHESPSVFLILESTAEGVDNWWHRQWKYNKANWGKGARFYPMFLPWFIGTDMYPTATWIKDRPVPNDFEPLKETRAMMNKAKMYVDSSGILSDVLGKGWSMGREQAWFWQVKFLEARSKGLEKSLMQELPTTDVESFISSFDSVFGNEKIEELESLRNKDFTAYGISGHGVEDRHLISPDDVDYESCHKLVNYKSNTEAIYSWTLSPVKRDLINDADYESARYDVDGLLLVFRDPEPGYDYTIGVDTGYGKGQDSTCVSVWRKGSRGMPDMQVAEFAAAFIHHVEAFPFVMAIAAYYARYMRDGMVGNHREPLVSIEVVAAVGDPCQLQMRKMGYGRFFRFTRYDTKNIKKQKSNRLGWYTSGWSRPILIGGFVNSVKNEWAEIHSPMLLHEMSKFEVHSTATRERLEHADGHHDDRIFAAAIAILTSHDLEDMVDRGKNRPIPVGLKHRPKIDCRPTTGYTISTNSRDTAVPVSSLRDLEDYIANERHMH